MEKNLDKILTGYRKFRQKYAIGDESVMQQLSAHGQEPEIMVVACCDSRVDPGLILQCDPGDLFVVRNVANIIPPYEIDDAHHGTSAALEFGVCFLHVKHIIILGHSQCGGIQNLLSGSGCGHNDFISSWMSIVKTDATPEHQDEYARLALKQSYQNCMTFPWIKSRVDQNELRIHQWFFDIKSGEILKYSPETLKYEPLE